MSIWQAHPSYSSCIIQLIVTKGGEFGSAVQAAAFAGNTEILRHLLRSRPQINYRKHNGLYGTPLHAAVLSESIDTLKTLLEYKHFVLEGGSSHCYLTFR